VGNGSQEGVRKRLLLPQGVCGATLASSCAVLSIPKVSMKSLGIKGLGTCTLASQCFAYSGPYHPMFAVTEISWSFALDLMGARLSP